MFVLILTLYTVIGNPPNIYMTNAGEFANENLCIQAGARTMKDLQIPGTILKYTCLRRKEWF